jgi:hypothetical protein
MWMIRRIAIAAFVIGLIPFAMVAISLTLAWVFGCNLNEGNTPPCLVVGADISRLLVALLLLSVPAFVYTPLMVVVVLGWMLIETIFFVRARWFS